MKHSHAGIRDLIRRHNLRELRTRGSHVIYVHPAGFKLSISRSPSDRNVIDVIEHEIRNRLRTMNMLKYLCR